jgi:hypothetical protein
MKNEPFKTQKLTRKVNEDKVISLLKESRGMRFSDLSEKVGLSIPGLIKVLDSLKGQKLIKNDYIDKKVIIEKEREGPRGEIIPAKTKIKKIAAYKLTDKGDEYARNVWSIIYELLNMRDKNATYFYQDHSFNKDFGLAYGDMDSSPPNSNYQLLDGELEDISYRLLKAFEKKIKGRRKVLDPEKAGKLIVFLEIDCKKLIGEVLAGKKIRRYKQTVDQGREFKAQEEASKKGYGFRRDTGEAIDPKTGKVVYKAY